MHMIMYFVLAVSWDFHEMRRSQVAMRCDLT